MNNLSTKAKILLGLNGLVVAVSLNPDVQKAVAGIVSHHPWLSIVAVGVTTVAHLFTDAKAQ